MEGPTLRIVWYLQLQINFPWFCKKSDFRHFLGTFWHPKCSLLAPLGAQREAKAAQEAPKKRTLKKQSKKSCPGNPPAFRGAQSRAPPPPNPLLFLNKFFYGNATSSATQSVSALPVIRRPLGRGATRLRGHCPVFSVRSFQSSSLLRCQSSSPPVLLSAGLQSCKLQSPDCW